MIKEAIGTAETIEDAKESAINQLNAGIDDDIQFEILEMPKKKTLGIFGGSLAKVRAFIELEDPEPKKPAKKQQPKQKVTANKGEKSKPKKVDTVAETECPEAIDESELPADSGAAKAINYIKPILNSLGCTNVTIKAIPFNGGATIILSGDGLGVVIGHRGETLDSLQYLASLAANSENGYFKVSIDIGNYRERREKTLIALANRLSAQVLRSGRNRSLEPMNPYERRIIHTAVQEIEGVSSHSVGEGDRRHVVITCDNPTANQNKKVTSEGTVREPKKDSEALPLYGKIK